eukprot:SAG31_NODE_271_length_18717_cov_8.685949_12_plen_72_part_00
MTLLNLVRYVNRTIYRTHRYYLSTYFEVLANFLVVLAASRALQLSHSTKFSSSTMRQLQCQCTAVVVGSRI